MARAIADDILNPSFVNEFEHPSDLGRYVFHIRLFNKSKNDMIIDSKCFSYVILESVSHCCEWRIYHLRNCHVLKDLGFGAYKKFGNFGWIIVKLTSYW